MTTLSSPTEKLARRIKASVMAKEKSGAKIHVDYIASRVASFYEKIRKLLEYQEEHLFRKNAIDRSLKRRLLFREGGSKDMTRPLILELIRAGYLPNDTISEEQVEKVKLIIDKYVLLIDYIKDLQLESPKEESVINWLISLASCEIEEKLAPATKDTALAEHMYETLRTKIVLDNINLPEEEKNTQLFIAIQRALLRADNALINYRLLKWHFPQWENSTDILFFKEIATRLLPLKEALSGEINHPIQAKFFQVCNKYNTPFLILGDTLVNDPDLLEKEPDEIEGSIEEAYKQRLQKSKTKTKRAAIYATLSIFATKVLFALLIEVPFDLYITNHLVVTTLAINIAFPPFLMFLIVASIRPPGSSNTQKVVMETIKTIYQTDNEEKIVISPTAQRSLFTIIFVNFFYGLTSLVVFSLIVWVLLKINFSIPSIIIFLVFLSLICFAGLKIRQRSKELNMEKTKENFLVFLIDVVALPLVSVGKWLSGQWARFNILIVIFNFILEVPFQIFLDFIESWRHFIKEKKEEIQ